MKPNLRDKRPSPDGVRCWPAQCRIRGSTRPPAGPRRENGPWCAPWPRRAHRDPIRCSRCRWRPGLATGARWWPIQCLIRGAAGRHHARASGKTAEDAHSGCDACSGRNAKSLEGTGTPGWEHDCSQGASPRSTVPLQASRTRKRGKRASGRGHLVSDYAAIT